MSAGGRVKVTLPLNTEQRASLASWRVEYDKAWDAAQAEYDKACDAARAEYKKACDAARAEYIKACGAARAEYEKARAVAWAEYNKACDAAWAEYDKVRGAAGAEYDKVCAAAWAEYDKARDANPLVSWIIANFMGSHESEVLDVIDALADGADLDALRALAKDSEWCDAWDTALSVAARHFDIEGLS